MVRSVAEKLAGKAAVVQVNLQEHPMLAQRFGIRGVPVTLLLKNGRVAGQLPGAQSVEAILAWFRQQTGT